MNVSLLKNKDNLTKTDLLVIPFLKDTSKKKVSLKITAPTKEIQKIINNNLEQINHVIQLSHPIFFHKSTFPPFYLLDLGNISKYNAETLRQGLATLVTLMAKTSMKNICLPVESFPKVKTLENTMHSLLEGLILSDYTYTEFKSKKAEKSRPKYQLWVDPKHTKKANDALNLVKTICQGVYKARDLVNCPPNVLNSEIFAKEIQKDAKKNLKHVTIKILGKDQIKKQNMNLLLAVNQGSAYEPRVVHLTYTPPKATSKTKHLALVGKGLTFDSGGYSLKPSGSMKGMKFDMAGAATLYGAFRNAVLLKSPYKITCILGMTDNMVSSHAIVPDTIIKSRKGHFIEILNTDAEGRLVLADILDYACDQKPNYIIDCATLTGACIRALGNVCGVMGNNDSFIEKLKKSAENRDEYVWNLPLYDIYRKELNSNDADYRNIGTTGFAGAQIAACFLELFVDSKIPWIHLDVAGVADKMPHLAYCNSSGASGYMIRTLTDLLAYGKL